jgi:3-(3-hydroxy-phenyl)propionate hydroxylase
MLNSLGDDNAIFKAGPAHGAPPQNVCLGPDDYLLDHLGGGLDLLYFTQEKSLPASLSEVIAQARTRGLVIRVTAIGAAQVVQGADQTFADTTGHLREQYGVKTQGGGYLLRPDQHICARWVTLDAVRLQAALNKFLN